MSPDKRCQWCTFWNIFQMYGPGIERSSEGDLRGQVASYIERECRKQSPKYERIAGRSKHWPETTANDWCGDFEHFRT